MSWPLMLRDIDPAARSSSTSIAPPARAGEPPLASDAFGPSLGVRWVLVACSCSAMVVVRGRETREYERRRLHYLFGHAHFQTPTSDKSIDLLAPHTHAYTSQFNFPSIEAPSPVHFTSVLNFGTSLIFPLLANPWPIQQRSRHSHTLVPSCTLYHSPLIPSLLPQSITLL